MPGRGEDDRADDNKRQQRTRKEKSRTRRQPGIATSRQLLKEFLVKCRRMAHANDGQLQSAVSGRIPSDNIETNGDAIRPQFSRPGLSFPNVGPPLWNQLDLGCIAMYGQTKIYEAPKH